MSGRRGKQRFGAGKGKAALLQQRSHLLQGCRDSLPRLPLQDVGSHQAVPSHPFLKAGNPCTKLLSHEGFIITTLSLFWP